MGDYEIPPLSVSTPISVNFHSALQYILTDKGNVLTGRLARWKLLLQEYPYEVVYRPGVDNVVSDALSRHLLPPDKEPPYDESHERLACLGGVAEPHPDTIAPIQEDPFYDEAAERIALLATEEPEAITPVQWKRAHSQDFFCSEMIMHLTAERRAAVRHKRT